jgi:hypothetical protein
MIMVFRGGMARRRPLLRAAVVGGGAYVAGRHAAQRSAAEAEQEARLSDLEQAQQAPQQVPAPRASEAPADSSMMDQLSDLVRMHEAGALTDEEFTTAKARLLG